MRLIIAGHEPAICVGDEAILRRVE